MGVALQEVALHGSKKASRRVDLLILEFLGVEALAAEQGLEVPQGLAHGAGEVAGEVHRMVAEELAGS